MLKPRFILAVTMALVIIGLLPACKEGCTDRKALNYDHTAKQDNGLCLYCDTASFTQSTTIRTFDQDSSFQSFDVADMAFYQTGLNQKGNGCRTIGLQPGQGCNISLTINNVMNKHIAGSYFISFNNSRGINAWTISNPFGPIDPHGSLQISTLISNQCDSIGSGFFNIQLSGMSYY